MARLTLLRNRGELAEGWYDPSTKQKAIESSTTEDAILNGSDRQLRASPDYGRNGPKHHANCMDESDDDVVGPALPTRQISQRRKGPAIPGSEDLVLLQGG